MIHKACDLCGGACCKSMILNLNRFPSNVRFWMELHGEVTKFGVRVNVPCGALAMGRCMVEGTKPQMCKDLEVGSENCIEAIHRYAPEKYEAISKHFNKE